MSSPSQNTINAPILAVDDRPENLVALDAILSEVDHVSLTTTTSGQEALGKALTEEFAIILLDVQMPGMDGYECASLLRSNSRTRHVPIVFITAGATDKPRVFQGYEAGAVDYICKPVEPKVLQGKVLALSDLYRHRCALKDEITLRKKTEAALIAKTSELERANEDLLSFSYMVAHDLRSPLTSIVGYAELMNMRQEDDPDPAVQRDLNEIITAGQRMAEIIDDILMLTGLTHKNFESVPVDLSAIATDIMENCCHAEPDRKCTFTIEPDLMALGDSGLLRTVLENLLGNAWKYSGKESESSVELGKTCLDGDSVFFVRDNGAGFDSEKAEGMFKPFKRFHAKDDFKGTGVGLSIAAKIVEMHGGRIWAKSEPEKGATFYFTLNQPDSTHERVSDSC